MPRGERTGMSQPSASGLSETPIDATVRLMTPERIVFEYPLGGPFRRFTAYVVDLCLLASLVVGAVVVALMLSLGAASGLGPALVAYFLLSWGYGAFCEGVFNGQTPGKRALGLRVVSERGVPITGARRSCATWWEPWTAWCRFSSCSGCRACCSPENSSAWEIWPREPW